MDVVAVGLLKRGIGIRVLHRHLGLHHAGQAIFLAFEMDDRRKRLLVGVEPFDEFVDAPVVVERLFMVRLALVVAEVDGDALVEKRQLPQTGAKRLPLESATGENRVIREKRDRRPRLVAAVAENLKRLGYMTA